MLAVNRSELLVALDAAKIDPDVYDIFGSGDYPSERYVLRLRKSGVVGDPDDWVTYYCERGAETSLTKFASEDQACRHFFEQLAGDKSTPRK
ncbi:MAG TPA: hypothetical protein VGI79_10625 [Caulobacteraceae bacterium]|jgi:hypothetical protein